MVTHWNPKQRLRERERETRLSHCLDVISSTLEGSSCRAHAEKTKIEGSFEGLQKNDERHNECFASFVLIALENPHMFITIKDNDLKAAMAALPIIIAYYQQCDWWIFNVCCVGAKLAICWQHIFILLTLSLLQLSGVWNECSFYCLHNHWFSKSALLSFGWECKTRVGANRTFFYQNDRGKCGSNQIILGNYSVWLQRMKYKGTKQLSPPAGRVLRMVQTGKWRRTVGMHALYKKNKNARSTHVMLSDF